MKKISLRATAVAVAALAASQAWATNGMLMEGYGPIALSMGGASQAYDNGTAGMMNNPATLMLGANGTRADVALGILGPNVVSGGAKSDGTSYVMPAAGWIKKSDQLAYGVGIFGQGGMGTEFGPNAGDMRNMRSELGVGRVIFPFSYRVNSSLAVGATVDYSWAGMDMQMNAPASDLVAMMNSANPNQSAVQSMLGPYHATNNPNGMGVNSARLSFSNSNDFTGAAKATGWTGKLGFVFKPSDNLTVGFTHQLKTHLADMKTGSNAATFAMYNSSNVQLAAPTGQIVIHDFQMPSVTSLGGAFAVSPALTLVADVKRIGWASVMKKFSMTFVDGSGMLPANVDFAMDQHWKDQTVVSVGGAYKLNDATVVRAGYSHSSNPVPDTYVHPLFPATIKNHLTAGVGYQIGKSTTMDIAISHAPKVSVTNAVSGMPISHSQTNYQLMLSYRY